MVMRFDTAALRECSAIAFARIKGEDEARAAEEARQKAEQEQRDADQMVERALVGVEHLVDEAVNNGRFHITVLTIPEGRRRWDRATDLAWIALEKRIIEMNLRPTRGVERVVDASTASYESWVEHLEAHWD